MKKLFLKLLYQIYVRLSAITKPVTIGVRVLLIRDEKVLLVKHSYQDLWFLVGGGMERYETLEEAARREAMEEAGATLGEMELFGIYTNYIFGRSDHIVVFLCENFTYTGEHDSEIESVELLSMGALPKNTAPGIRRRIEEYRVGEEYSQFGKW